ncbi:MAG: CCA tRNA nucleotidyltransferase, partial [Candidatus Altiarchaeota archaeon]|nr:CCA tRNA nucleotidyltransferase [Candidatus Altiarchaeota archaeon]
LSAKDVKPILVGSLAKNTDLRGDKDIDIFIMFDESVERKELEERGLKLGKELFSKLKAKYEIDYAEHPYVMGRYKDYDIEIVPCYTGGKMLSSVDRTPLHTRYIKRKIRENKQMAGEIRLLKQFMKGAGVYGAEAKVQGFSGYLAELLTLHYGSFAGVLAAAGTWKFGEVSLDTEKQWENPAVLKHFFTGAPLIVVDPVDRDRNVAAAVSKQRLAEFVIAAQEFLKQPSIEYFFPKEKKVRGEKELEKNIRGRGTKIVAFVFTHGKINPNSLYDQLRATEKGLMHEIHSYEFSTFRSGHYTNEKNTSIILLEFDVWQLPKIKHQNGPPIDIDPVNQERFLEKYRKDRPVISDGRWVVTTKRQYTTVEALLPKILEERHGFGKEFRTAKVKLLENAKILGIRDRGYRRYLDEFL